MSVVIVSWILVLLAVFGVTYAHDVRSESELIQLELERQQLRAWARSGVELARSRIEKVTRDNSGSLGSFGPDNPFAFPLACGRGWFAVGSSRAGSESNVWAPGIADETGRLPMAVVDSIALSLLPGMSESGIDVILKAKEQAGSNRLPPFELWPDLDQSSVASAGLFLSRYGKSVNINTASREVMIAVGLPEGAVKKLLDWRSGKDRVLGTSDDRSFTALNTTDPGIDSCSFNSEEAAVVAYLGGEGRLAIESRFFSLAARGWGEGHHGVCEIKVVLEKPEEGGTRVLEWTENWLN